MNEPKKDPEIKQTVAGPVVFKVWGKLLSMDMAYGVKRRDLLPLGDCHGVTLFLDGSKFCNPDKSDCCLAWCLPVVTPPDPKKNKTSKEPKERPVATHEFSLEKKVTFEMWGMDFEYSLPELVPTTAAVEGQAGQILQRQEFDWSECGTKPRDRLQRTKNPEFFSLL